MPGEMLHEVIQKPCIASNVVYVKEQPFNSIAGRGKISNPAFVWHTCMRMYTSALLCLQRMLHKYKELM
jgi:hypothetical protein